VSCHDHGALADAQARFELLFEHSVDGVFFMTLDEPIRWDADADQDALLFYAFNHLRVTHANPAMCKQLGMTRDELVGKAPAARWKPEERGPWQERMRILYNQGRASYRTHAPRDGKWYEVEGTYVCLYDDEGRITGHFGTQREIGQERAAEQRLEVALTVGEIAIWDYDLVAQTIHFDAGWLRKLGYEELVGEAVPARWWGDRTHPADFQDTVRAFTDHMTGKTPQYRIEHRVAKKSGDYLWLLSSGRVTVRDRDGKPQRFIGTSVDITERKQLQERVAVAERMASIGTLAAGVAHEINNPLTYIVLNLTLLDRQLAAGQIDVGKLRNMVSQARYGTDRVSAVVRDLQALTRVREERITLVDPVAVVERCLEIADHQIRHRAHVVRELAAVPPVRGSEDRLVQLFLNLVINAAQAIPDGAADRHTIRVRSQLVGEDRIRIDISDSGAGIAPETLSRIFDPFFTTKPVGEGTGLGLAICRTIVSSFGGEISVESTVGVGTTFTVLLPVATAVTEPAAEVISPRATKSMRILVVDDEPLIGQVIKQVLAGHTVTTEVSAQAALERITSGEDFDRIFCDLMMPELSGMDFYQQLSPAVREKVVFLSGGVFTDRARDFLDTVPNRRLDKPFDTQALSAALAD
jgi:PAS domain S-box-containing protein